MGTKIKAKDYAIKLALLSALIGSFIILVVPFLEWIKHDTFYKVWYSTGLDLMTDKYRVLQPFLVFVAGAFGIVGAFAIGKRANLTGLSMILAASILAVFSFLYWIFSNLYLVYAGGGRTIKMTAPWLLLVGAGCFCFSTALNYIATSKKLGGRVGTLKPKRIIILVAIGSLAMLVLPFLNWVSVDYVYVGRASYSGLYLMVREALYIILPPIGGALGVAGAFALTSSRRRAATASLILIAGAFAIVSLGWFIVNVYTQGFPISLLILGESRVTVTAESVLCLLAGAGCFMLSAKSVLSTTRQRSRHKVKARPHH